MLRLYKPAFEELGYRRSLLSDPATMSYNEKWGGTVDFPKEKWEAWYGQWLLADKRERWYRYLYSENEGCFVGEIAYRYDSGFQAYIVNLLVVAKHRGKGYGRQGLRLLLETAEANGITRLCDTIAADNPAVALFLDSGFTEVWRNDDCIMVEYAR